MGTNENLIIKSQCKVECDIHNRIIRFDVSSCSMCRCLPPGQCFFNLIPVFSKHTQKTQLILTLNLRLRSVTKNDPMQNILSLWTVRYKCLLFRVNYGTLLVIQIK